MNNRRRKHWGWGWEDQQPTPTQVRETAAALRSFLLWAIAPDETNAQYLADANFVPLPAHVWVLSHDQIEEIK